MMRFAEQHRYLDLHTPCGLRAVVTCAYVRQLCEVGGWRRRWYGPGTLVMVVDQASTCRHARKGKVIALHVREDIAWIRARLDEAPTVRYDQLAGEPLP